MKGRLIYMAISLFNYLGTAVSRKLVTLLSFDLCSCFPDVDCHLSCLQPIDNIIQMKERRKGKKRHSPLSFPAAVTGRVKRSDG
mmetsp:Transcript_40815/g.41422  ORF Transcript_40815/g.41422 Transcript_40815/m.41422 type:complete len:84 (+) Transcript_40815:79-330(+)